MGGNSWIDDDGYVNGGPELIAEVAASSAAYDLHDKLKVYRRSGVQEYIVWQVHDGKVDWFRLRDEEYVLLQPDEAGVICSEVFPGLCLNVPALLDRDLATVLAELQEALMAEDHAAFVQRLTEKSESVHT